MRRWHPRSIAHRALVLGAALALVVAACSSGDDAATMGGADVTQTTAAAEAAATTTFAASGGGDLERGLAQGIDLDSGGDSDRSQIAPVEFQATNTGRKIIFTGDMTVAVPDVLAAGDAATGVISRLGGFMFGQQSTGSPSPRSVLIFKVEPVDFQAALDGLAALGDMRSQNVSASDVTDRIVDLDSRILSAQASVERLRGLLDEVAGIPGIVQIETELLARETQLETLRGQQRTLTDQVAFATITLTLTEARVRPDVDLIVTAYAGHDGGGTSCHGEPGLTVDEGTEATVCFEIVNTGDVALTDIELTDPVLDLEEDDLIAVLGPIPQRLEPGESLMLAAELIATRDQRTQTRVSALPVGEDGESVAGQAAATTTMFLNAVDPGGIAGFSDGLSASVGFLVGVGRVLILTTGVLLPFVWLAPILVWLVLRARRRDDAPESTDEPALGAG